MFDNAVVGSVWSFILTQSIYLLRIALAAGCGGLIGYERKSRGKNAGIRTHLIVATASAVMMIVSKYGFSDLPVNAMGLKGADAARIAAQVVSGVGFLGAGTIYFNNRNLQGLTTAAGIWATAGVGLAFGAGMYVLGIIATAIMLFFQIILHKNLKFMATPTEGNLSVVIIDDKEYIEKFSKTLSDTGIQLEKVSFKKNDDGTVILKSVVIVPQDYDMSRILELASGNNYIKSIELE